MKNRLIYSTYQPNPASRWWNKESVYIEHQHYIKLDAETGYMIAEPLKVNIERP